MSTPWTEKCTVRKDKNGKATRHNWQRLRDMATADKHTTGTDYGGGKNAVYCNFCHITNEDIHVCDKFVSYYIGNWPHYKNCDKPAKNHVTSRLRLLNEEEEGDFWVCDAHTNERIRAKRAEADRRERERFDVWSHQRAYGYRGQGYEDLLVQVADWMASNRDLVEADEWLRELAGKIGAMPAVMERLPTERRGMLQPSERVSGGE